MSKSGPQNTGKEEVLENAAQYTPLRRVYTAEQMRQLQPRNGPSCDVIRRIAEAGVLRLPKAKL